MDLTHGVIKSFHPHPISFLGFYFMGVVFVTIGAIFYWPVIAFGLLIFLFGEILRKAETFYILETGVAKSYNFFSTSRKFTEYENIQNIEVGQSFLENMLGIGSIKFDTSGSDKVEVSFYSVPKPYDIEHLVRQKMSEK